MLSVKLPLPQSGLLILLTEVELHALPLALLLLIHIALNLTQKTTLVLTFRPSQEFNPKWLFNSNICEYFKIKGKTSINLKSFSETLALSEKMNLLACFLKTVVDSILRSESSL